MGSIVLGAIGSSIGGPIGGMIGGQLGSLIDNKLFNHRSVPKPSLQDLQVEAATMGLPIPKVYGRSKLAGNLIMSSILKPKKHHGKGGASSKGGQTYYTYSVDCAVAICKGPIENIWRIYADTKVIWDMDPAFTSGDNSQPIPRSGFVSDQFGGFATFYHFGSGKNANTQLVGGNAQFYFGTEDQGQDALCDILFQNLGFAAGTVPAYRGIAYVVFIDFPLADFGNRIPNFSFEVNGFYSGDKTVYSVPPLPGISGAVAAVYDPIGSVYWNLAGGKIQTFNSQTLAQFADIDWGSDDAVAAIHGGSPLSPASPDITNNSMFGPDGSLWFTSEIGTTFGPGAQYTGPPRGPGEPSWPNTHGFIVNVDPRQGVQYAFMLWPNWGHVPENINPIVSIYCGTTDLMFVSGSFGSAFQLYDMTGGAPFLEYAGELTSGHQYLLNMFAVSTAAATTGVPSAEPSPTLSERFDTSNFHSPSSLAWSDSRGVLVILDGGFGVQYTLSDGLFPLSQINAPSSLSGLPVGGRAAWNVTYDVKNDVFLYWNDRYLCTVRELDVPVLMPEQVLDFQAAGLGNSIGDPSSPFQISQYPNGGYAIRVDNKVYIIDTATMQVADTQVLFQGWDWTVAGNLPPGSTPVFSPLGQGGIVYQVTSIPDDSTGATGIAWYRPLNGGTVTLSSIVTDICLECGLEPGQVDTSALTETVYGYTISQETNGRGAIEQLEEVFLFDHVEVDGRLKSVHRATSAANPVTAITIDPDDLGARASSPMPGENAQPRVRESIKQDFEIPKAAYLRYRTTAGDVKVRDFSMQVATVADRRNHQTTSGVGNVSLNTPIVMDEDQASQVIQKVLRLQYVQRTELDWTLPVKYIALTPGDVVPISWVDPEGNNVNYYAYIQQADIGADNTIKFHAVAANPTAYAGTAIGQSLIHFTQPMAAGQPTTLDVMELPPLQDADDSVGVYYGACGIGDSLNWSAVVQRSIDNGESYATVSTLTTPAAIGVAKTVLNGGKRPGVWDLTNTVTVSLVGGALASYTPLQVLNRSGVYLVGQEIIGACNATENADGTWTLSTLLRGMQGTDQHIDQHIPNERVVALVLDGSIQEQVYDLSQVGVSSLWAGVTVGSDITSSRKFAVTLTGNRIKPLPAARARIERDDHDNATIIWTPRRRIGFEWQDGIERGVDETIEDYAVDIYDGAGLNVVRTISSWSKIIETVGSTPSSDTGQRQVSYSAADQLTDGLVGAGAAWDPATSVGSITFSSGNLTAVTGGSAPAQTILSNFAPSSGAFYFEVNTFDANSHVFIGVSDGTSAVLGPVLFAGFAAVAVNLNTRMFWSRRGPTFLWNDSPSADPAAGTGGISLGTLGPDIYAAFHFSGSDQTATANFGATAFQGSVPAAYGHGFPGPLPPVIEASIYQISSRIGRGCAYTITG